MRNGYPLVELHRHLDGNVRLETIIALCRQHGLHLPGWTVEELRPHVQVDGPVSDVMTFIARFEWLQQNCHVPTLLPPIYCQWLLVRCARRSGTSMVGAVPRVKGTMDPHTLMTLRWTRRACVAMSGDSPPTAFAATAPTCAQQETGREL